MLATKVEEAKREEGFTLIELLVVVIIIGILAAIAIPVFLNQRERAWQRTAEADARNAAIAVESFFNDSFNYPAEADFPESVEGGGCDDLGDTDEICNSPRISLEYTNNTDSYVIEATHELLDGDGPHATYNSAAGGIQ